MIEASILTHGIAFLAMIKRNIPPAWQRDQRKTGKNPQTLYGERLHQIRLQGDYNIDSRLTTEQADTQIIWAEQFLELVGQLIGILPK